MPSGELDISWQVLRRIVQAWAGTSAELAEVKPLVGGCINITLALKLADGQKAVVKISPHRVNRAHEEEAHQLKKLGEMGLPVPRVYGWAIGSLDDPFSYILMEFVEGIGLAEARQRCAAEQFDDLQRHLAEIVLALHAQTSPHYLRVGDGSPPRQFEKWPEFFREVYGGIWHEAEKSPLLPVKARKQISRVHERLDRLIMHDDQPRLVHWDIWSTNLLAAADAEGRWRISGLLDPNCKFAHFEAEIAYLELFHTITPAFLKAYQQTRKLPAEYHQLRKPIYQLYSLINHVRLFGSEYVKPLLSAVERVSALV